MSARKPKRLVAVDWDSRKVRVVFAQSGKRGVKVDRLLSVAIPGDLDAGDAAQMGRHIRRILDEQEISAKHAVVDIPRDQAILNTLTLPVQVPDALPGMVGIQVAKQLPFALADAVIDYVVGAHEPEAATGEVLVAAVRREVLAHYEAVFAAAGLKLDRVGLRSQANRIATMRCLRHSSFERVLMIDVRPTLMEINVIRHSFLVFSRAASVQIPEHPAESTPVVGESPELSLRLIGGEGTSDETGAVSPKRQADSLIQSLIVEVTRSIEAYRATDAGARMDHVVVAGDTGVEERLAEALQQKLGVAAELYNPASSFGWEPDEGAAAAAFSSTLGLLIGHAEEDERQFDFLHPKRAVSATEKRLKKAPLVAAVVLLFVAAGGVALASLTKEDRTRLANIERKIRELEAEARTQEHAKFVALVKDLQSFDADQFVWVDVLLDIVRLLPPQEELVIHQIDGYQRDGRLVLKTRAKRRETATAIVQALNEFRGEGKQGLRFRAQVKGQSEKPGEDYPFMQDLQIAVVGDGKNPAGGSTGRSGT